MAAGVCFNASLPRRKDEGDGAGQGSPLSLIVESGSSHELERVASRYSLLPNTKKRTDFITSYRGTGARKAQSPAETRATGRYLILQKAYVPVARGAGASL